ncbi:kelch-like protein 3 [Salvia splendens]|uniref:kelch-like protein 3 n=1 Tax=Salvia splendens TaxID=180675 RepID=UPI001C2742D4|nr:kelch-like protein 3 [Salvia splendens]XP_042015986.1 kelch-like protein 3 [Salvia splendens]XP_042015990.1 kelch-like protein 3 [Salvia splendens]
MVVGRTAQTYFPKESFPMALNGKWARNLSKNQLGSVIFGCTKQTMDECLTKQLFGLPAPHFSYVKNIEPGLPLFLFNYSERKLHGIYEAVGSGKMNIDPYAWTIDGSERTRYQAQVQVRLRLQCQALTEIQFKLSIFDNYYGQSHFRFELDHAQTSRLISQFSSQAVAPRISIKPNPPIWTAKQMFPSTNKIKKSGASEPPTLADNFSNYDDSLSTSTTSDNSISLNGNKQLMGGAIQGEQFDEKDLILMKIKELALSSKFTDANLISGSVGETSTSDDGLQCETRDDHQVTLGKRNSGCSSDQFDSLALVEKLYMEIEELKTFKLEQITKTESLANKLVEAEQEILRLQNRCSVLEYMSDVSEQPVYAQELVELPDEYHLNIDESILIVGGYDGVSWSSALQSFLPSKDILRSLKPMSSARWNAPVVGFNGELYVFGGGSGSKWYDTVESYNIVNNEWTLRPSLNKERGSLAGAALNNKIFAMGGGNAMEFFSDVEMYDPFVGRWIPSRSMLQKRYAHAAVELNGALYAVGGYDGQEYLNSAERFDPRENSWTRIASMEAKRGLHSLVVMNEKIYALGGYDGTAMTPSFEIYDPRRGSWMTGEPMKQGRGYFAAGVLHESIYVIGGVETDEQIIETVECYKEGAGWESTNLRAVGKRCFASAIVLEGK